MNASNTFKEGMIMDVHPLTVPNNILTNCLNGTLVTSNGNELILQNDIGNSKVIFTDTTTNKKYNVSLTSGFVPIGLKQFGNIMYIFSVNPNNKDMLGRCLSEIGTFPSPDYTKDFGTFEYNYKPLHNYLNENSEESDFRTYELDFDINHPITIDC